MRPFLIALQFLTCVPVRLARAPDAQELGRSLLWYPAVGLLIGLMLWFSASLLALSTPLLCAAVLLAIWVAITGALHIDGLADCADAWIGGRGDRERTLAIMKDPHAGPIAVAVVVLILLLKFAAIDTLISRSNTTALLLAPVLARTALPALFLTTAYVRRHGLGSALSAHVPRTASLVVLVFTSLAILMIFRFEGFCALIPAAAIFMLLRAAFKRRLDGFTGDCAGAMAELIETGVLLSLALGSRDFA